MKIPETTANVGAYYGNEENGQWQPNGVILDGGVGGGVVGSGDAGFVHHAPVYPVPRHMATPGYVMAGAYYEPGAPPYPHQPRDDFADYMWMENEEEFDKQVMQQLEEEALMEQCIEAMLEDEQRERRHRPVNGHRPTTSNGAGGASLAETISRSTLNPLAAEFVPTRALPPATADAEKPVEVSAAQEVKNSASPVEAETADSANEESHSLSDTPEVSAAEVHPAIDKTERRATKAAKRAEAKKPAPKPVIVAEVKKRPQTAKGEANVPAKKEVQKEVKAVKSEAKVAKSEVKVVKSEVKAVKSEVKAVKSEVKVVKSEVKAVKSEVKLEESLLDGPALPEPAKTTVPPVAVEESAPAGPKPINYAAAAKANKPKKATTPPATEKAAPPPAAKTEKTLPAVKTVADRADKLAPSKDRLKADRPTKPADRPRKNSAK